MLNVEDMLFHGISFANWQNTYGISYLELVELVLKDGFLLTRKSIRDKDPLLFNCLNYHSSNGNNRVSVCCHPKMNKQYLDFFVDKNVYWWDVEAFGTFVYNDFSVILNKKILNDSIFQNGIMLGEFQIYGDVSLTNMEGFGIPNFFERIYKEIELILSQNDFRKYRGDYYVERLKWAKDIVPFLDNGYCGLGYNALDQARILLSKYHYDVPIVDPETGMCWPPREEAEEKIEFIRDLAVKRKLIKF